MCLLPRAEFYAQTDLLLLCLKLDVLCGVGSALSPGVAGSLPPVYSPLLLRPKLKLFAGGQVTILVGSSPGPGLGGMGLCFQLISIYKPESRFSYASGSRSVYLCESVPSRLSGDACYS